jgi:Protein of unknown function (DUF2971)
MLFDRLYKPTNDELIYHYCGADAFAQIIRTRTMWHTAFTALNDASERKWGFEQFQNAADELRKVCGADFVDRITEIVRLTQDHSVAMVSSYSLDGDLLSQWRAYAGDGHGFAIGFFSRELEMPAKPLRVLYERAAQRKEVAHAIKHGHEVEKRPGFNYDLNYMRYWFDLGLDLCAYKHPAFAEEKEIRRAHISFLALSESEKQMFPLGAIDSAGNVRSGPVPINYRNRNGVEIPYVSLDITDGGKNSPIKEIVLGPKNHDKEADVEKLLTDAGWKGVKVRRSDAPYV